MKNYYKTRNEVMTASLEDKIDTLLFLNSKTCEQTLKSLDDAKKQNLNDFRERNLKIGPLVYGEAYYHEVDEYYDVIGFLVESECEFRGHRMKTYGFRGIYFGNCNDNAPIDFDEGTSLRPYGYIGNGYGDEVEILDVIISQEDVDKCITDNNININKYLKEVGLLLPEKRKRKKRELEIKQ